MTPSNRSVLLVVMACSTPPAPTSAPVAPVLQATRPAAPAPPPALVRPPRTVVVGGCLADCDTADRALRAFLRAAQSGDAAALRRHVDTSTLHDHGAALGDRWADAWEAGRLAERETEIAAWIDRWASFSTTWIDPGDRTRDPEFTIEKSEPRRLIARWRVPEQASDRTPRLPRALVLTFGRRGLEWLVTRVEDAPP